MIEAYESHYQRLMGKIDVIGDHWIWTGAQTKNGYGKSWYQGRSISAHRLRLICDTGFDMGPDWDSSHTCEFILCIKHTEWKSHFNNMQEREYPHPSHCIRGHEYTDGSFYWDNTNKCRLCKECVRIRRGILYAKNKDSLNDRRRALRTKQKG